MNDAKYIGLDIHQATISVAVLDSAGNLVMEANLETNAETILQFIHGLSGRLHVTFEEGTCAVRKSHSDKRTSRSLTRETGPVRPKERVIGD